MNAFTSSDWTAYLFASKNKKDFVNLMEVYLDATFFPLLNELDFAQEGHRLEFINPDDPNSELTFKGVVLNEMKGALSAPVQRLGLALQSLLFPTTTYHYNSGGDPELITSLTHQQLKDFHARHYHPSNTIFLTYGDIPAAEHQAHFEHRVLRKFGALKLDFAIPNEKRRTEPTAKLIKYPLDNCAGNLDGKTHIVLGWLLGPITDPLGTLRAKLLSDVLLDNSSSPLRHTLETSILGASPSPICGFDTSTREATFSCGLEGVNPEQSEVVEKIILDVLHRVADEGVTQESIDSALHQLELSKREITGDGLPYGLRLLMDTLIPAMHGGDATTALDIDPLLRQLREESQKIEFIPCMVRQLLLDNQHRVRLTMVPDSALIANQAIAERKQLASIRTALSDSAKALIISRARCLSERQQRQDDPELLPRVGLDDVPSELKIVEGVISQVGKTPAYWYTQGTNGMVYLQTIVDMPALSNADLELIPLFCACLTRVGSAGRDYRATQARHAAVTGGVKARAIIHSNVNNLCEGKGILVISGKALEGNQDKLSEILLETMTSTHFDELPKLREIVAQIRIQREEAITEHGHILALLAACSSLSPVATLNHQWDGMHGLKIIKYIDETLNDRVALQSFATRLEYLRNRLCEMPKQLLIVSEAEHQGRLNEVLEINWKNGIDHGDLNKTFKLPTPVQQPSRVGFLTNTQVNFCAKAYPTVAIGHADAPALQVLGDFLRNGYLHRAIREQGGAYGSSADHPDSGSFRFYSYRDPRLSGTFEDFDRALDWLQINNHLPRTLEEAILGVIASIDKPGSPAGEAISAFFGNLFGYTPEQRQLFRRRVLKVTIEDLKRVAITYLNADRSYSAVISDSHTLDTQEGWTVLPV
jgi:Zn-dependent M16 (insulinase) family peptidase